MNCLKSTSLAALLVVFLFSSRTHAQSLILGIKAGANFDKTQGKNLDGKFSGNFLVGGYAGVRFTKIKVTADVLFSQSKITTGDNFGNAFGNYVNQNVSNIKDGKFKMSELSIPVLVGFNILPKLLWIQAGPQYTGVVSINDVNDFLKESKDVFKSGYLSGVVGAELELPFSLNAGLRYIFGISDRNNTNVNESWRTSHFQLHVGYSFLK
jgi:hypothetical protein